MNNMKRLTIRNFGPIDSVVIELKRVNLILGPQSSVILFKFDI